MSDDPRAQPPLPFEPALQLVVRPADPDAEHEVPLDRFATLLFDEVIRRAAGIREPESRA